MQDATRYYSAAARFFNKTISLANLETSITDEDLEKAKKRITELGFILLPTELSMVILNPDHSIFDAVQIEYKNVKKALIILYGRFQIFYNRI